MSQEPVRKSEPFSLIARLLAVLVALGLSVVDPFGWDPFGPLRWLLVPALGFAAGAVCIGQRPLVDKQDEHRSHRAVLVKLWGALLGWGLVATIFAADPLHAWIGTPDRRFGWLTWLLCGALFVIAADLTAGQRSIVSRGFVVGALGLGCYTALEWSGLAIDTEFAGNRLGGPFGQPAYLGAGAALVTPMVAGAAAERSVSDRWRWAAGSAAALCVFSLLASQSRAAWVGVAAAGGIWLVVLLTRRSAAASADGSSRRTAAMAATAAAIPVALVLAIPTLRERLTSSFGEGGVIQGRIDEWQVGWRALAVAPVFGHGPEGYRTVFGGHVDEGYVIDWGRAVITDRAHSGFLDVGLIFGIPGALIHLAMLTLLLVVAVRAVADGSNRQIGLGLGMIAYIVQQQFLFPLSEIDPLFWIAAGLLVAERPVGEISTSTEIDVDHGRPIRSTGRSLAKGLLTGLAIVVTIAGLLDWSANLILAQAIDQPESQAALDGIDTSIALRPDSIRYRFIGSRVAGQSGAVELALRRVDQGLDRSPTDPALRGEQARLLLDRARAISSEPQRTEALDRATAALDALVADDPNHPAHLQRLGIALALGGDFARSIEVMQRAIRLAPADPEPQQNLAEVERLRQENRG